MRTLRLGRQGVQLSSSPEFDSQHPREHSQVWQCGLVVPVLGSGIPGAHSSLLSLFGEPQACLKRQNKMNYNAHAYVSEHPHPTL